MTVPNELPNSEIVRFNLAVVIEVRPDAWRELYSDDDVELETQVANYVTCCLANSGAGLGGAIVSVDA